MQNVHQFEFYVLKALVQLPSELATTFNGNSDHTVHRFNELLSIFIYVLYGLDKCKDRNSTVHSKGPFTLLNMQLPLLLINFASWNGQLYFISQMKTSSLSDVTAASSNVAYV